MVNALDVSLFAHVISGRTLTQIDAEHRELCCIYNNIAYLRTFKIHCGLRFIVYAATHGNLDICKYLNVQCKRSSCSDMQMARRAMCGAIDNNHADVVAWLIEVDIQCGTNCAYYAAMVDNVEIVKLFPVEDTLYVIAAESDSINTFRYLPTLSINDVTGYVETCIFSNSVKVLDYILGKYHIDHP
jgi:hypothetical protein